MIKKKKELDVDKILLDINELINLYDHILFKSCNKRGKVISITTINNIEYNEEESIVYLERKINDNLEVLTAFMRESIKDIDVSEAENGKNTLILTITT